MMWLAYMFIFMSIKDFYMFSIHFIMDGSNLFLLLIMPVIYYLIVNMLFNVVEFMELMMFLFFFLFISIFIFISACSTSPFIFYIFMELLIPSMSYLVMNLAKGKDKVKSLFFFFNLSVLGSVPFLFFCYKFSFIYSNISIQEFNYLTFYIKDYFVFFFFLLVLLLKIPIILFHFWLPKVHVSASGCSSMILAGLIIKVGAYGFFKFNVYFLFFNMMINSFLMFLFFSIFFMSIIMTRCVDVKYLVACSSILHMSLMMPMMILFKSSGIISCMFMIVSHGLISSYMFYLLSFFYENMPNRSVVFNSSYQSLKMSYMQIMVFFFLNLGIPPFMNFYSEFLTIFSINIFNNNATIIFITISIFSVIYLMFFLLNLLQGKKDYYFLMYDTCMNKMNFFFFFFFLILMVTCL